VSEPQAQPPTNAALRAWSGSAASVWTYANLLLRRRQLVLALPVVAALLGGAVSLLRHREYVAIASFVPQEPGSSSLPSGLGQLASQFGLLATRGISSSPQFYADLLTSREMQRDVVITSYPALGGSGDSATLIRYFRITSDTGGRALLKAMRRLPDLYSVRPDRLTGVVRLDVHTTIPDLSVQIVDRFLELVNEYNLRRRQSQARAEREFVGQQVAAAQSELAETENGLADFYRRNRRFADSPGLVAEEGRLRRQVELRQQLYLSLAQGYETAKIDEVRNTPVITVIEHPEGLVEPKPRGTVKITLAVWFLTLLLTMGFVSWIYYLDRARVEAPSEYREFVDLKHAFGRELRRLRLWNR